MRENKSIWKRNGLKKSKGLHRLKTSLISQSFSPLYLLLIIKYFDLGEIRRFMTCVMTSTNKERLFFADIQNTNGSVIITATLMLVAIISIIRGIMTYILFENMWKTNTVSNGEKIVVEEYRPDVSITFFVAYILPLMIDDANTLRGFLIFIILMAMMTVLLRKSNLYYQNPVLTAMGYRAFKFKFSETSEKSIEGMEFIGLTKGGKIDESNVIKRRILEDDIVLVFKGINKT